MRLLLVSRHRKDAFETRSAADAFARDPGSAGAMVFNLEARTAP